jgi:tetratricopeptide (TPR) repeat protein
VSYDRWQKKTTPELLAEIASYKRRIDDHREAYHRKKAQGASESDLAEHNQELVEMGGMVLRDLKMFVAERLIQEMEAEQPSGTDVTVERLSEEEVRKYFDQAQQYHKDREFHQAVAAYNTVLSHNSDNAEAYYKRGLLFASVASDKAVMERARADYSTAIRLKPDFIEAYMKRADSYGASRLHPEVIDDYTEVIRLSPTHQEAYRWRGYAYSLSNHYPEAIADLNEVLRLNPTHAGAYWFRSGVYLETGDYDLALEDCKKAEQYGWGSVDWRVKEIHKRWAQKKD